MPYVNVQITRGATREQKAQLIAGLEPVVIRMVREMPGYLTGFWSWDHTTNMSYGTIVFETEANARALENFLKEQAESLARAALHARIYQLVNAYRVRGHLLRERPERPSPVIRRRGQEPQGRRPRLLGQRARARPQGLGPAHEVTTRSSRCTTQSSSR